MEPRNKRLPFTNNRTSDNVSGERHRDSTQLDPTSSLGASEHHLDTQQLRKDFYRNSISNISPKRPGALFRREYDYGETVKEESALESFVDDPLYQFLYEEALLKGSEIDNTIRVNVVGNFAQGKTSLTNSLVGKINECVLSTDGVDINHCKYFDSKYEVVFERNIQFDETKLLDRIAAAAQVKDIVGNEESSSDTRASLSNLSKNSSSFDEPSNVVMIETNNEPECEIDSKEQNTHTRMGSIDEINSKRDDMREEMSEDQSLPTQAKSSLLSTEDIVTFRNCLESNIFEKNIGGNLEIWDFAGQFVFYATHTLFHSKRAVYLLVFDLSKPLSNVVKDSENPLKNDDKTMKQYIKFWMNSIHSFVGSDDGTKPPVILVGTHKDKLDGNEDERANLAEDYFEAIRTMFDNTTVLHHIHQDDFAVNCVDPEDKEIVKLRKEIIRIGMEHAERKVPARWIPLERALLRIRHMKIIPFNQVIEIDSHLDIPLKEEEQIKLFLLYHHTKGTVFYFEEKPFSDYVVLDTQFLIDAFKCIVTSEIFCRKNLNYRKYWRRLKEEAKLDMELIDIVWGLDSNSNFIEHKNEILMFMEKHLIISQVSTYNEDTDTSNGLGWYVVPSLLRDHSDNEAIKEFCKGKMQSSLRIVMSFNNSLVVQIIYHRLIAALISKWPVISIGMLTSKTELLLYKNLGVFRLDKLNAGAVELQQNTIDMRVISLCSSHCEISDNADKLRRFAELIVINEFKKMRQSSTSKDKPFETYLRCNNESHGLNGSHNILLLENLKEQGIEPCPDMTGSHDINPKDALSEWFKETSSIELTKDCRFDDKQLSKVSTAVGMNWEKLGIELGLSIIQIQHIQSDNETTVKRIFKMLKLWEDQMAENATVNTLIRAMQTTKKLFVEWDEVRNVVEEIESKQ